MKVDTQDTYGQNIKNCKKILTLWEITNRGYRKINESYIFESINNTMEFSANGKYFVLSCNDSKTFIIYDAQNLSRINKFELKAKDTSGYDVTYFYSALLSKDGSYLLSGDGYQRYVFDKEGKFVKALSGRNMYTIFMYSPTEFVGIRPTSDYTKSDLVAVDFIKDSEKTVYNFDQYVSNFNLSPDNNILVYDYWPKVYIVNIKSNKKNELLSQYSSVYKYAFKDNKIAIAYSPTYSNMTVALYEDEKVLWKHNIKKSYMDIHGFRFSSDDKDIDSVMMIENQYTSFQIYRFEERVANDYTLKTIRNITFQYPQLAYAVGTKEIWVQDINGNIRIYFFDLNISGMENESNVKLDAEGNDFKLGLILDNQNFYQIAEANFNKSYPQLLIYSRKIIKDDLPDAKVKAFYKVRVHNQEKKKIDKAILLHLKDTLVAISLESRDFKHELKKKVTKFNCIAMRDESAIFFWEDNGSKVEKLKIPIDPLSSKKFIKVYEANEDMRLLKTTVIDGEEYLYIVDEAKHMKILKNEENRLSVYKDYFVDPYFATYADVNSIRQFSYSNEMLYSSSGGYILQEKGKDKEFKFSQLYYSGFSFDYNNYKFPMCSDDFILFAMSPQSPPNDYSVQYQDLLLCPPMNSHRIKQRSYSENMSDEIFLHYDDKYILYYNGDDYYKKAVNILQLNGELVQEILLKDFESTLKPIFSQSGEYMCSPQMINAEFQTDPLEIKDTYGYESKPSLPCFKIFKINKGKDYKTQEEENKDGNANNNNDKGDKDKQKEIASLELVNKFEIPHQFLMKEAYAYHQELLDVVEYSSENKNVLHVDNEGHCIYINPTRKAFLINNHDVWDQFSAHLAKGKLGTWDDDIDILKFGQGFIIIKTDEILYHITYDGVKKKLTSGKVLKHKALDIPGECDLEYIVPTRTSQYVNLFYKLGESMTIVVWDLEKNYEHTNFSSRQDDTFKDFFTGTNSKLGIVSFDKYIVDLDNGIPNPFMNKKYSINQKNWTQGCRINSDEDMILSLGTIITPLCHKDIYYSKYKSLDNLDYQKIVYYLNKNSVAFDYLDDHEKLNKILDVFKNQPIYYSMLILENHQGKTALDIAIENNSAKIIEIILNSLLCLDHFSLSKMIYRKFSVLFQMNLKAFEKYLNTCFFETQQMASITKAKLGKDEDTIRENYTCCILDKEFYIKYEIGKIGSDEANKLERVKSNAIAPLDRSQTLNNSTDQLLDKSADYTGAFEEDKSRLKRVQIKGVEFDWIFNTPEGHEFLKNLSETTNIEIFGQDIIKDIILFQWSFFRETIIYKLLIPYFVYFIIFCIYATWIIYEWNLESSDTGEFHLLAYIVGAIILMFNCFWAYVEITQMMFHKMDYIFDFWNMLDSSSVCLNITVVIMVFLEADYHDINRVSSVSVLILYFKLFYFLRIFFETGYLIRMIIEIIKDMKNFVGVLMIATIAFANSFYILGRNSEEGNLAGEDVWAAFIFSYKMGLGDFNTDGFETVDEEILWIIFVINTLIILVVLLNLVIAIMGDTFDRVQETQDKSMLREIAQMIRENEFLFSRKKVFKRSKYIIVIEPEKAEGEGKGSWEGKLNQLKTFIEESSEAHIGHLKKLEDGIENIASTALDEKLRPIEDKINNKLSQSDQRLEKLKKSVEHLFTLIEGNK